LLSGSLLARFHLRRFSRHRIDVEANFCLSLLLLLRISNDIVEDLGHLCYRRLKTLYDDIEAQDALTDAWMSTDEAAQLE
jgi:hypothetical protein